MSSPYAELALTALAAMLSPTTLSFTVFALVLGERPLRTGLWFFLGAYGATLLIGVLAAFVLGDAAAPSHSSEQPPTAVAILDVVFGALLIAWVVRAMRRPPDPQRITDTVEKMSAVVSSPAVAIVAAGATLANPGGFIPIALKSISQANPSTAEFVALWAAFGLVALLPLVLSLIALWVAPELAKAVLTRVRVWLERHARTLAAAILVLLAAALLRNGIVALA